MRITCACLFVLLLIGMGPKSPSGDTTSPFEIEGVVNAKAPDFVLRDINGRECSLASLKGKVVILNFWATWCPPCKAEMPSLNRLYSDLKPRGLEVVAISSDRSVNDLRDFLAKNRFDFLILFDEKKAVTKQYKVFSMPTTLLINRQGVVVERLFGEYEWTEPETRKKIENLL